MGAVAAPSILPRPDLAAVRAFLAATAIGPAEFVAVGKAALAGLTVGWAYSGIKRDLDTPGRPWTDDTTVGREYDAWTEEQILEYYWGEHIHLGYYTDEDLARARARSSGAR